MSGATGDTPTSPSVAALRNHRRVPSRPAPSDDEDQGTASDPDHHRDRKRPKVEHHTDVKGKGKARVQYSEEDEGDDDEGGQGVEGDEDDDGPDERQHLVRHDDGYVTGSIVRIACHSFLTYDSVEFRPGPALNMIIGPNGTGKSTIACAIAIGLGFPAKVLGRSTKLSAYCKNDSNEPTWIELELKGKPGDKNLVVRRHLSRDSEKTRFELDGKEASAKAVMEQMEDLQVQIGNLCTFLPQDRVASFAMMSPSELLRETQRAAGNENLTRWHQVLIDEWKRCKEAQSEVDRLSVALKRKQDKQADTEKEVRAFEQRERLEQDATVAQVLVKFGSYNQIYGEYMQAREDKTTVRNEVDALEAKNRPFRASKDALEGLVRACRKEQDKVEKRVHTLLKDAEQFKGKLEKLVGDRDDLSDKIREIKQTESERRKVIAGHRKDIDKWSRVVADEPAEADTSELDRQLQAKNIERNEIANQVRENEQEVQDIHRRADEHKRIEQTYKRDLEQQQQVKVQREQACAHFDKPTWKAVEWLRQHGHQLRGRVVEPARLHLSIKRELNGKRVDVKSVVDLAEAAIPLNAFSTFIFEFREDYDRMYDILVDEPNRQQPGSGLAFNGTEGDVDALPDQFPRALSPEQLDALGLDCHAIDLLEGPPAVLAWLCKAHNLHRVPVQIHRRPVDARAIENGKLVQRYYTPDGSSSIRFSMYGNRFAQVDTRTLKKAKILNSGVDQKKVDQCNAKIQEAYSARAALKTEVDRLAEVREDLVAQVKQMDIERKELSDERGRLQKARQTWNKAKSKLDAAKLALEREQSKPSETEQRATYTAQLRKVVDRRVKAALGYSDATAQAVELQEGAIKVHLQALQADSDHRAMDAMVREKDEELEQKKIQLEEVSVRLAALLKEGKKLMGAANEALDATDGEVRERILARRDEGKTLDELEEELREIETNLACMGAISPVVLELYNKRKGEIADQKEKLEDAEARLNESKQIIETTEKRWLPSLERLVSDISAKFTVSFDTLGLLGEVRLAKDEDYEKWGIEIMVSFRDRKDNSEDVALHVLSGHRQSGGERALTTVTYLLALAELARAPFALVDEINQGMDQRAERNMHKMLVKTTCDHDVGQYFLLTPKLLPDLVYHPKMKVLVINVSPYVPGDLSLQSIIAKKRKLVRAARKSGQAVMAN